MTANPALRAPWPYPGGKSRAAARVWSALGEVGHYVEPFFGSGAVLLARPAPAKSARRLETVNDADGLLCNAWRGIQLAPAETAKHAAWPVSECDLHARHAWLIGQRESLSAKLSADPEWCDPKAAGWWIWGIGLWIGDQFGYRASKQLPVLGFGGGAGVHNVNADVPAWFDALSRRFANVRVTCGDWKRVCSDAVLEGALLSNARCGIFLDPPYENIKLGYGKTLDATVSSGVRTWCVEHGTNPRLRIVLAGENGEHDALLAHGWTVQSWRRQGGWSASQGGDTQDCERLWLSPHCVTQNSGPLFGGGA